MTSFQPLKFKTYKEGVVRIAAKKYDPGNSEDLLISLTGNSFRKRSGIKPFDLSVEELLYLSKQEYEVDDFWLKIDEIIENVLRCLSAYGLNKNVNLINSFFMIGWDVILQQNEKSIKPVFLEINYFPQLISWNKEVDKKLIDTHKEWLSDLYNLCQDLETTNKT